MSRLFAGIWRRRDGSWYGFVTREPTELDLVKLAAANVAPRRLERFDLLWMEAWREDPDFGGALTGPGERVAALYAACLWMHNERFNAENMHDEPLCECGHIAGVHRLDDHVCIVHECPCDGYVPAVMA